ncbi:MAG TPA: hypothetical protein VN192_02985 [Flavobacterium sp.]|jgi:hypothetical protein|nr:hypothetical protein [Flavobacterium sp.]
MKTIKFGLMSIFMGLILLSSSVFAQEEKSYIVTVTKLHWNMELENFKMDEWKVVEKEYLEKVVKKNPLILEQEVLMHYFTADNTELLLVTTYENWEAIEKANAKSDELEKLAWPNEKDRKAFMEKRMQYYAHNHSDEIHATMKGAKQPKGKFDKDMLYYLRVSHFAYPKDSPENEFNELRKQYFDAVTNKNDLIKAYYPAGHAWGADNTEFTEVYVVDSLADLDKALDKNDELLKAAMPDENKRKEFNKKYKKYFTGVHGDYIYSLVHELSK